MERKTTTLGNTRDWLIFQGLNAGRASSTAGLLGSFYREVASVVDNSQIGVMGHNDTLKL